MLASKLQAADVSRQLTATYKINRVRRTFGVVPIASNSLLKTTVKYIFGLLDAATTV